MVLVEMAEGSPVPDLDVVRPILSESRKGF
jgi:hypothetical protein